MHHAAESGYADSVGLLLESAKFSEQAASSGVQGNQGKTALHLAAEKGHASMQRTKIKFLKLNF